MKIKAPPTSSSNHHDGKPTKPSVQELEQRLKRVQGRLAKETDADVRAALEDRLVVIQGKLDARKEGQHQGGKSIEKRLEVIQAKLAAETDPEAIKTLKEREEKLNHKRQQLRGVPEKCLPLEQRIQRVQGLLQEETDPSRRAMWEGRLELMKEKLAFKQGKQTPTMKDRLKWQERLLAIDCNPKRREEIARRVARMQARQRNMERKHHMLKDPIKVQQKREQLKDKLLQREAEILATHKDGKDSKAFKKLVLQKVYVAHYPLDLYELIPPHKDGPEMNAKRAEIRKVAIERARTEPHVDWIGADQYDRLPKMWSYEKELTWFGKDETRTHVPAERKRQGLIDKSLERQKQAAKNGNEMALKKIALYQVVLAHYPENPVDKNHGPHAMKSRAEMRKVSLELAQMEPHVSWMTEEQYSCLPKTWSLEDELAVFGKKKEVEVEEEEFVVLPDEAVNARVAAMDLSDEW